MKIKDLCSYAPKSRIKAGEAVENAKYLFFTSSADENKRYTDFQFDKEAIIMGTGGNATLHYYNGKFSVSTDCLVLFPNSKIKCKYLYYFFKSHMSVLEAGFKGAGLKHTNKKYIEEINVSKVPDLSTQEKIVSHLDTITENIEKLNRELELFDSLTKARFIEMFGDPENNPNGWMESPLSEKLSVLGGFAFKSDKFSEISGIPILRIGNINSGHFKPVNMVYWKEDENLERYLIYPGDLVMSLTGTVGKDDYGNVCILGDDFEKYYLNQRNAKLEIQGGINKFYLSQLLKFTQVKKKLTGISRGVRQANISNKDILNLVVPIPPIELQQQFEDFVHQVDKSREEVKKSLEKTQQLYDSLMQEYFG